MLRAFSQWLNDLPPSQALAESDWAFPIVESIHVLALTLMVGTVALVDLRLLNLAFRRVRVSSLAGQLLPLAWAGFALMAASGVALFASEASKLYDNPAFRLKVVLLLLAGLNPLIFHVTTYRGVAAWDHAVAIPARARLAAAGSLTLWSAIIICGRMIAYFH
ncbi:DUF6644 family protein [Sphingomonas sp. GlSt437]|uniref:DUF6644 family protein n=1 Tax=Sphingomonas sp. GlSt437 TaxID=3389970 RepID=UPI003A87510A